MKMNLFMEPTQAIHKHKQMKIKYCFDKALSCIGYLPEQCQLYTSGANLIPEIYELPQIVWGKEFWQ